MQNALPKLYDAPNQMGEWRRPEALLGYVQTSGLAQRTLQVSRKRDSVFIAFAEEGWDETDLFALSHILSRLSCVVSFEHLSMLEDEISRRMTLLEAMIAVPALLADVPAKLRNETLKRFQHPIALLPDSEMIEAHFASVDQQTIKCGRLLASMARTARALELQRLPPFEDASPILEAIAELNTEELPED